MAKLEPTGRCERCAALARGVSWHEGSHVANFADALAQLEPPIPTAGAPAGDTSSSRCRGCGHWYALRTEEDHRGIYDERIHTVTWLTPTAARARLSAAQRRRFEAELPGLLERVHAEARSADPTLRADAGWWLARDLLDAPDEGALLALIEHERDEVRLEALRSLSDDWPRSLRPAIEAALERELPELRRRAAARLTAAGAIDELVARDDAAIARGILDRIAPADVRRHLAWLVGLLDAEGLARPARTLLAKHVELGDAEALRSRLEALLVSEHAHARRGGAEVLAALVRAGWDAPELAPRVAELLDARATEIVGLGALTAYAAAGVDVSFAVPKVAALMAADRGHTQIAGLLRHLLERGSVAGLELQIQAMLGKAWSSLAMTRVLAVARARSVLPVLDSLRRVLREGSDAARFHAARAMICEGLRQGDAGLLIEILDQAELAATSELAAAGAAPPIELLGPLVARLDHEDRDVVRNAVTALARFAERGDPEHRGALARALAEAPESRGRAEISSRLDACPELPVSE